jgi:Zn-dependent peptidase ImmA (M78 family)/plasmid maintenance system antidote protein VapI
MISSPLTEISAKQIGDQLRFARKSINLTLQQVSKQLKLAISTLSDIERGKRQVSSLELFKLSKIYGRPIDFFLKDRANESFSLLLRAANETSISKETIVKFQTLCRNYSLLKNLLKSPDAPSPPDYSRRNLSLTNAEEIAETERSSLGLNGQAIKDVSDLLESKRGIMIFHLPEQPDEFSGAFASEHDCGACMLINSNHPLRRRTFTIAHEYAHCIAHKDEVAHIDFRPAFESRKQNERFADAFAAAFLMPRGTVLEILSQLQSSKQNVMPLIIIQLANYFGVSFEAAGWRLVGLRKLSRDYWYDILDQHIPSTPIAKFFRYDIVDNIDPEMLPRQYKYLCYQAYEQELISFERLAELLNRNYYELRQEIGISER